MKSKFLTLPLIAWFILFLIYVILKNNLFVNTVYLFILFIISLSLFFINFIRLLYLLIKNKKCLKSNIISWHLSFTLPIISYYLINN